jgi:hypothetical protein
MRCDSEFTLNLRSRAQVPEEGDGWEACDSPRRFSTTSTAILVCDMWDRHWCDGATLRIHALAPKVETLIDHARASGVQIIHSPSDTMFFYRHYPERRRMLAVERATPPAPLPYPLTAPALPVDDSDEGCDTEGSTPGPAWTRENIALSIDDADVISDSGEEIFSFLRSRGITDLLFTGVHANKCILDRPFGIKQMTAWGIRCVLIRDLTDAIYNPKAWPYVSVAQGTELVVEYIEKYWCPSVLSEDVIFALNGNVRQIGIADGGPS